MVGRQGVCFIRRHVGEVGQVEDQVSAPFGDRIADVGIGKEVVNSRLPLLAGVLVAPRKPQERIVERRIGNAYRLIEPTYLTIRQLDAGFPFYRSAGRPCARTIVGDADTPEEPGFQTWLERERPVVERQWHAVEELVETARAPRCFQASSSSECKDEFADTPLGAKTAYVVIEGQEYCAGDIVGQHTGGDGIGHGAGVGDAGIRSEEHTSELQSLMRISYAVFCLKKKNKKWKLRNRQNTK